MRRTLLLLIALLPIRLVGAVPPPPQSQSAIIALPDNNCPVTVAGTARPYQPVTFEFDGKDANVLVLAIDKPRPELVFEISDETHNHALVVSGAGFGEGDVRVALAATARYALRVHIRGDYARNGTSSAFKLRLFLRQNSDAPPCANTAGTQD